MPKSFTLGSRVLTRERLQRQATEAVVESRFRFRALHSAGGGTLKGRCPSTSEVLRHCNGAVVVHDSASRVHEVLHHCNDAVVVHDH